MRGAQDPARWRGDLGSRAHRRGAPGRAVEPRPSSAPCVRDRRGRGAFRRDGVRRRRGSLPTAPVRTARLARGHRDRDRAVRRAGHRTLLRRSRRRAGWDRPRRHQAAEHPDPGGRPDQGARLRHRQSPAPDARRDAQPVRQRALFLARAPRSRTRRLSLRPVVGGGRALRDARRPAAVPRRERRRAGTRDPLGRAAGAARARNPAGIRGGARQGAGARAGRPLCERPGARDRPARGAARRNDPRTRRAGERDAAYADCVERRTRRRFRRHAANRGTSRGGRSRRHTPDQTARFVRPGERGPAANGSTRPRAGIRRRRRRPTERRGLHPAQRSGSRAVAAIAVEVDRGRRHPDHHHPRVSGAGLRARSSLESRFTAARRGGGGLEGVPRRDAWTRARAPVGRDHGRPRMDGVPRGRPDLALPVGHAHDLRERMALGGGFAGACGHHRLRKPSNPGSARVLPRAPAADRGTRREAARRVDEPLRRSGEPVRARRTPVAGLG